MQTDIHMSNEECSNLSKQSQDSNNLINVAHVNIGYHESTLSSKPYCISNKCSLLLDKFVINLKRWNSIHNITGSNMHIKKNINDSLYPVSFLQPFSVCIDIGSGAGFPAIPLACYYVDSIFYLIEPSIKKSAFLETLIFKLRLTNVKVISNLCQKVSSIKANLITSRGIFDGHSLVANSRHLLANNGKYLLFKGSDSIKGCENIDGFYLQKIDYEQRIYAYLHSS